MAPPQTTGPVSRLLLQRNPRDWVIWKRQVWPSETAWQGLFERAQLQAGERVLIHGGSGEVGIYAIQPARRAGAHVITTASARNFDLLSQLGANEMIDYRTDRFEDRASNLDVVFETVGGETLKRSWGLLKS